MSFLTLDYGSGLTKSECGLMCLNGILDHFVCESKRIRFHIIEIQDSIDHLSLCLFLFAYPASRLNNIYIYRAVQYVVLIQLKTIKRLPNDVFPLL